MKIDDGAITARLTALRRKVGGKDWQGFIPRPPVERVDADLTFEQVEDLFDLSGLLIHNGQPVFAYIRDHLIGGPRQFPHEGKRIHFTVCGTLRDMKKKGRFERYRVTSRNDNRYLVDVKEGWRDVEREEPLFPCRYCLANLRYQCFSLTSPGPVKQKIVEKFDAKEAFDFLWQHFDIFHQAMTGAKSAALPTGYTPDFNRISREYRRSRGFTCERCGARLHKHKKLTDLHHKNSDKRDNREDNLVCLCKLCHAKEHAHYRDRVSANDQRIIEATRRTQQII